MKKFLLAITAALACQLHAAGAAHAAQKLVSVLAIVEHPALDAVRDGVRETLAQAGYKEGDNLRWQYQSAQGSTATAAQIARKFIGDGSDVIVAIATPTAQAAVAATSTIPVVFSAVTDPVAAKLTPGWGPSGTNVTGMSDQLPLDRQVDLILQVVPKAKKVGMVFNPGEVNSVVVAKELRQLLAARGMELIESSAPRATDVADATRRLAGEVDAIYVPGDNNVVSSFEAVVKVAREAKVPLIASDTGSVERGAAAALGINYHDLGVQTGKIVVRVLNGEKPGSIAPQTSDKLELYVNPKAAQAQGITLSPEFIRSATKVVD